MSHICISFENLIIEKKSGIKLQIIFLHLSLIIGQFILILKSNSTIISPTENELSIQRDCKTEIVHNYM